MSERKKVLVTQPIHESGTALLEPHFAVRVAPDASPETLLAEARDAHAILVRTAPITRELIEAAKDLQIIARHGVGVDEVDVAAARARGIMVTNAPGSNSAAVAEHALALILALVKQLKPLGAAVAQGGWRDGANAPGDLAGKRLGLVGFGAIGQAVARLALAFGVVVSAFDPTASPTVLPEVRRAAGLADLLGDSDILSLHCPLTPVTHHLIDAAALAALPSGAFVVNTARGGLIDEAALRAALDAGHLGGAALDVFESEPPSSSEPLRDHPRVLITPHAAGTTPGALERMGVMAAECIAARLTGAPVPRERIICG